MDVENEGIMDDSADCEEDEAGRRLYIQSPAASCPLSILLKACDVTLTVVE